ncbi:hypothetical protein GCM10023321_32030 [Pseudonocardia eucalypti]|uniref:Uncharacterized protein n=1 Tax=Pseudonocardia eucalypti TaxID=648755 RepID=A0ABP9Q446_9PSEU
MFPLVGSRCGLLNKARYSRDASFAALRQQARFVTAMAASPIIGILLGGLLLGVVSAREAPIPLSSIKVWKHDQPDTPTSTDSPESARNLTQDSGFASAPAIERSVPTGDICHIQALVVTWGLAGFGGRSG